MSEFSYLFVFGRTPLLSFTELTSFFPSATLVIPEIARVDSDHELDVVPVMSALGGTVKIARYITTSHVLDATLAAHIPEESPVTFGVSLYGEGTLPKSLLADMKKDMESRGITARYVAPHEGSMLSSVTVDKKHAQELVVCKSGTNGYIIGKTLVLQQYDDWNRHDYGRPFSDAKSGMLPVKVARMLVNIALGNQGNPGEIRQQTVYDPFCGMGTIVGEAYLRGCRVFGSDVSEDIVRKAKGNLSWLIKQFPNERGTVVRIFAADAVHASESLPPRSVHAIVTEPFMGSTSIALKEHIDMTQVRNQLKGLEKLYIGCLKDWHKILAENGKIIIALPSYVVRCRELTVKKVVDMCEILGYTIEDGPIEYSRSHAVVKRNFYILKKQ